MLDALLLITFLAGLIPAVLFTLLYARRSAWRSTSAGRAIMSLMSVTAVTYLSSVLTLVWPDFFRAEAGVWLRVGIRVAVAAVLWNLLAVLLRSQRIQAGPVTEERIDV
jgi:hypothetical protein